MSEGRYSLDIGLRVLFRDLGINGANVLRRAGLPADLLARRSVVLDAEDYYRLWAGLEAEWSKPDLPLRICEALTVEVFSTPIFAALCSENLNEAAQRLATFKPLVGPMELHVDVDESATTIECRWADDPPAAFVLTELLFWVALARIGTRSDVRPTRVQTTTPPSDQEPYEQALGVPILAGEREAITFHAADAARPFLTSNDAMWEHFEPSLRTRLADVTTQASTSERVRAALVELLPAGRPTVGDVGRAMAVSPRTLQRRLGEEGTSFQAELASTREALARHYLASDSASSTEIAFLLGYSDPSSFYRAFSEWTGTTPDRVRAGAA